VLLIQVPSFPYDANLAALSREFVENAVKALITRFMPLNPSDLENWASDPEEWVNLEDQENDQWEYEIRVRQFLYKQNQEPTTFPKSHVASAFCCSYVINSTVL
jgi:hypothetical protein